MKVSWTKGLSPAKKEEIRKSFLACADVRERLSYLIKEKITTARKESISKEGYETNNWAYKQADICGYERALEEIISIIS